MDTSHRRRRRRVIFLFAAAATLALLLLIASLSAFPSRQFSIGVRKIKEEAVERVPARRRLRGPGSSPPTCRSKCGRCAPCRPVHVAIQPRFSMKLEYYPEAWRCKCRNKLSCLN